MSEKIVAVIPARAGSKGLPGKNKKSLMGKPLFVWSIEAALESETITDVVVTTDDEDIYLISQDYKNVNVIRRRPELAGDSVKTLPVVLDALEGYPNDSTVVLLQPTSPLRRKGRIDEAVRKSKLLKLPVASVVRSDKSPYQAFRVEQGLLNSFFEGKEEVEQPRQKFEASYYLNGSMYVTKLEWLVQYDSFLKPSASTLIMNQIESIDIDDSIDFQMAEIFSKSI